jgi:hypothetical protein
MQRMQVQECNNTASSAHRAHLGEVVFPEVSTLIHQLQKQVKGWGRTGQGRV